MGIDWVQIARVGELDNGQMRPLVIDGRRLLLVYSEDRYFVIDEMCSHEDYSLALGCIKGSRIKCSLHGSYFDLHTGAALDEPAETPIRTYPVRIADGAILTHIATAQD